MVFIMWGTRNRSSWITAHTLSIILVVVTALNGLGFNGDRLSGSPFIGEIKSPHGVFWG